MPSKSSSARPAAAPKRSRAAASAAAEAPIPVPAPADPTITPLGQFVALLPLTVREGYPDLVVESISTSGGTLIEGRGLPWRRLLHVLLRHLIVAMRDALRRLDQERRQARIEAWLAYSPG